MRRRVFQKTLHLRGDEIRMCERKRMSSILHFHINEISVFGHAACAENGKDAVLFPVNQNDFFFRRDFHSPEIKIRQSFQASD